MRRAFSNLVRECLVRATAIVNGLIVHPDWSVHSGKRWMAVACVDTDGIAAVAPEPVGELTTLFDRLLVRAGEGVPVLLGVDFPIGLPVAYARAAGIDRFMDILLELGAGRWARFYEVANHPDEITIEWSFYPNRPGGTAQRNLIDALGLESMDRLRRGCDRGGPGQRAANPLFWTLGGNQVGKAAISGWRGLLVPALRERRGELAIWPFDGDLDELLATKRIVVAESYPADVYRRLGIDLRLGGSAKRHGKRVQACRAANMQTIIEWIGRHAINCDPALFTAIADGFGHGPDGEDRFDVVIGLFGMIELIGGHLPPGAPADPEILAIEGWFLGRLE
jgi:hypothetical protein